MESSARILQFKTWMRTIRALAKDMGHLSRFILIAYLCLLGDSIEATASREAIFRDATTLISNNEESFANQRYSQIDCIRRLRNLGPGVEQLAVDPSIVFNLDALEKFVEANGQTSDPWDLRWRFISARSARRVFRGILVTKEMADQITNEGIGSASIRNKTPLVDIFSTSLYSQASDHLHSSNKDVLNDPFVSVTDFPEVAAKAAWDFGKHSADGSKKVFVFEIMVPEVELLYGGSDALNIPEHPQRRAKQKLKLIRPDGTYFVIDFDHRTESFVYLGIEPHEIIGVKEVPEEGLVKLRRIDP